MAGSSPGDDRYLPGRMRSGRIVEHWDVIDYYRAPENGQLDQIFEDFKIKDLIRQQKIKS